MKRLKFGMRGHDIKCADMEGLFDRAAELGIDCIQLALRKSITDVEWKNGMFSHGWAREIKRESERAGVRISVLGSYINPIEPEEEQLKQQLEMFKENLRFAKYTGADIVGTETGFLKDPEKTHSEESYKRLLKSMKELTGEAEKLGVMIGIEPVAQHVIGTPERVEKFLKDIASPNVAVIFDPVNLLGNSDYKNQRALLDEAFARFGDRISVIHLKDVSDENGKRAEVLQGEGMFDFGYLFAWLKKNKPYIDMIFDGIDESETEKSMKLLTDIWNR